MQKMRLWGAIHVDLSTEKPSILSVSLDVLEKITHTHKHPQFERLCFRIKEKNWKKITKKKTKIYKLLIDIWKTFFFENEWRKRERERDMLGYSSELIHIQTTKKTRFPPYLFPNKLGGEDTNAIYRLKTDIYKIIILTTKSESQI